MSEATDAPRCVCNSARPSAVVTVGTFLYLGPKVLDPLVGPRERVLRLVRGGGQLLDLDLLFLVPRLCAFSSRFGRLPGIGGDLDAEERADDGPDHADGGSSDRDLARLLVDAGERDDADRDDCSERGD